jgi:alanine dehydrogenase
MIFSVIPAQRMQIFLTKICLIRLFASHAQEYNQPYKTNKGGDMLIGVPKEVKNHEYRVGITPSGVRELTHHGHTVFVQHDAGHAIGFDDAMYEEAGARILPNAEAIFESAEMIVKVKEPQPSELKLITNKHTLFCYLHLAPDPEQTKALLESGCTAIAFETVTLPDGGLPLLAPMSEVAGRLSIQAGAHALERAQGGRGVLLGGVPGVPSGKVLVIGAGMVGTNAIMMAVGMGAQVTVVDRSIKRLRELDTLFGSQIQTAYSTKEVIAQEVREADIVIGAALIPGASAPKLVTREMLGTMKRGAVLVDVAIDQGGCFETSHATTHSDPIYIVDEIVHYCVANMPAAVARTSTLALENATLSYTIQLANKGARKALLDDMHFRNGLNVADGKITHPAVAEALGYKFHSPQDVLTLMM